MQTQTLIQAQANVVKITTLKVGDVFKVITEGSTYSTPEVKYGVVTDMFNSGEKTFLEVVEYTKSYSSVGAEVKLYSGAKDIALFPATVEEIQEHFTSAIAAIERDIEKDKKALQNKIDALSHANAFVSGEKSRQLTQASFVEVSQGEYDAQKALEAAAQEAEVVN